LNLDEAERLNMFVVFLLFASALADVEMVDTPFGLPRRKDCVIELASDSAISGSGQPGDPVGVEAGGTSTPLEVPPECDTDGFVEAVKENRKRLQLLDSSFANSFLETKAFPINGWLDNAGSFPLGHGGTADISHFKATYVVPMSPAKSDAAILFYFIGVENMDDRLNADPDPAKSISILQPVLQWSWPKAGTEWTLASWDCCPKNVTVHSSPVTVQPGDVIQTSIDRLDSTTWQIISHDTTINVESNLKTKVGSFFYDWADVTMEVYHVNSCDEFHTGPMEFQDWAMKDSAGNALTPTWDFTGATACGGHIKQSISTNSFTVEHDPKAAAFRSHRPDHKLALKRNHQKNQKVLTP